MSRFSTDCSLLFCANSKNTIVDNPQIIYEQTVEQVEEFFALFLDHTIDIFCSYLPLLNKTRFASDSLYRKLVIQNRNNAPTETLSKNEINVLYWAALGKTAEESAIILDLSKKTIETYRKRALSKLNAKNITHAVYLAQYHNLIV